MPAILFFNFYIIRTLERVLNCQGRVEAHFLAVGGGGGGERCLVPVDVTPILE